ncbi:MAG: hypothetical protein MK135_16260 [Polyangiaceae bacterium]|nr:hypothetical protein [Polyangiaceae bacterium]
MTTNPRWSRQTRLAEIGEAGQARIGAHQYELPSQLSTEEREAALLYTRRAGLKSPQKSSALNDPPCSEISEFSSHFHHSAPQALGCGAFIALRVLHEALKS